MANVTDVAFRSMFALCGPPDVFWTEFVSADGLNSPGRDILEADLLFHENQRPIVAQLFTSDPDSLYRASLRVKALGFDGIDINMGCPDRQVEKQGCGADLIRHPDTAVALVAAARETGLPVSVKTRIGYDRDEIDSWLPALLRSGIAALTVHLRTRRELSSVPAHWEHMRRIVSLRDTFAPGVPVIGNGDVMSLSEGRRKVLETGCDGVMVGRGVFGNPWFFSPRPVSTGERLSALLEHTRLFSELLPMKSFAIMKKHYKAYVNGFDGAKELRVRLMDGADSADDVVRIIGEFSGGEG